jgi:hypothetical protein
MSSRATGGHEAWPTVYAVAGMVTLVGAVRGLVGPAQTAVVAAGTAAVIGAAGFRAVQWVRDPASRHRRRWLGLHLGLVLSVGLFFLTRAVPPERQTQLLLLWTGCLGLGSLSVAPMLAMEFALAPVRRNPIFESTRADQAFARGIGLGLLLPVLGMGLYLAEVHDLHWPLARGSQATPSPKTRELVTTLTEPVEVLLFYSRPNPVEESLRPYLSELAALNENFELRVLDHAVERELARELLVKKNGRIVVRRGDRVRTIVLGESLRRARPRLRRLDGAMRTALLYATAPRKVAYFTVGHGERSFEEEVDATGRPGVRYVADGLRKLQYQVRPLSLLGYRDRFPDDADLVFVMGPSKPFLDTEIRALVQGLNAGARLFVALEPGETSPLEPFLNEFGVTFIPVPWAHLRSHVVLTRTEQDRLALATNRYNPTPISRTLFDSKRQPTVFNRAGGLEKTIIPSHIRVERAVRMMPGTFGDRDGDRKPSTGDSAKPRALVMTVTVTSTEAKGEWDDPSTGRMVLSADSDWVSDELVQVVEGNLVLLKDSLVWLQRDSDRTVVAVGDEDEDVKLIHRREEDAAIFYGTTFGIPLLLLVLGWVSQRRRR